MDLSVTPLISQIITAKLHYLDLRTAGFQIPPMFSCESCYLDIDLFRVYSTQLKIFHIRIEIY